MFHDDVMEWKHFPCYWPIMRGIHWSPVHSTDKGQWRRALMLSLKCAWLSGWTNSGIAGDWRHHDVHVTSLWCWETKLVLTRSIRFSVYLWISSAGTRFLNKLPVTWLDGIRRIYICCQEWQIPRALAFHSNWNSNISLHHQQRLFSIYKNIEA